MPFPVHVHMLRHSTGYALANKGMDTRRLQHYLGHASITTERLPEPPPGAYYPQEAPAIPSRRGLFSSADRAHPQGRHH